MTRRIVLPQRLKGMVSAILTDTADVYGPASDGTMGTLLYAGLACSLQPAGARLMGIQSSSDHPDDIEHRDLFWQDPDAFTVSLEPGAVQFQAQGGLWNPVQGTYLDIGMPGSAPLMRACAVVRAGDA